MILVNATAIGREFSGIGRYALSLVRRLLESGRSDLRIFVNECALCHFTREERSRLVRVGACVSPDLGFRGNLLRLVWSNWLRVLHPEGVLFNLSPLEGSVVGSRQIVTLHDLIPLQHPRTHRKQYPYFKYWLPRVLKRTSAVIAVSQSTKQELCATYAYPDRRIHVIYHGVEDLFSQPNTEMLRGNYMLYVGRRSATKNFRRLVEAYGRVRGENGQLMFKVVGTDHAPVGAQRGVEMLGWVSDPELAHLYCGARLLAFPSLAEGFGLPALEAMACGCPVMAAKVPAIMEVCGDAAWYVNANSTESITAGIWRLLLDGDLRRQLSELGLERARSFTWEAAVKQHLQLFEEVSCAG
jgi:glycosyltransferase involved in cell wall biosynthesis